MHHSMIWFSGAVHIFLKIMMHASNLCTIIHNFVAVYSISHMYGWMKKWWFWAAVDTYTLHTMLKKEFWSKKYFYSLIWVVIPGVPTSFRQEFSKKSLNVANCEKNSWKFVYILAKHCRSHFNLTKNFKILISRKFEIFTKTCWDTLYLSLIFEQKLPFCNSVHCVCNVTHNEGLE